MRAVPAALLILILASATAWAVTVDQIVALSRAGVADAVVLVLIDRDQSVFAIEPPELVVLKQSGVSEAVILAMLKSGRQPLPEVVAAAPIVGPETIIVGHAPDTPNTGRDEPSALVLSTPAALPYMLVVSAPRSGPGCVARSLPETDPALTVPPAVGRRMTSQRIPVALDCEPVFQSRHRSRP